MQHKVTTNTSTTAIVIYSWKTLRQIDWFAGRPYDAPLIVRCYQQFFASLGGPSSMTGTIRPPRYPEVKQLTEYKWSADYKTFKFTTESGERVEEDSCDAMLRDLFRGLSRAGKEPSIPLPGNTDYPGSYHWALTITRFLALSTIRIFPRRQKTSVRAYRESRPKIPGISI